MEKNIFETIFVPIFTVLCYIVQYLWKFVVWAFDLEKNKDAEKSSNIEEKENPEENAKSHDGQKNENAQANEETEQKEIMKNAHEGDIVNRKRVVVQEETKQHFFEQKTSKKQVFQQKSEEVVVDQKNGQTTVKQETHFEHHEIIQEKTEKVVKIEHSEKIEKHEEGHEIDIQKLLKQVHAKDDQTPSYDIKVWVSDSISTIKDTCTYEHNTTNYDERIIEDIHDFIKNDVFFTIELPIICRTIKNSKTTFSVDECKRIIKQCVINHGYEGLQVIDGLECGDIEGKCALEIISAIDSPITNAIVKHPFMPVTKTEDTTELEAEIERNKAELAELNRKNAEAKENIEQLTATKNKLELFKEKGEKWPELKKDYEEKIQILENRNNDLRESIGKYKPAAMKEMKEPENFVDDIIRAIELNNKESVLYLLQKDPKLANYKKSVDSETWTPLMVACNKGNLTLVKILITNGARVDHSEWHGSPLSYAQDGGFDEIVDYLKEHGAE